MVKKFADAMILSIFSYLCIRKTESSAVGSALRSGRRGRAFESPLSDLIRCGYAAADFFCLFPRGLWGFVFVSGDMADAVRLPAGDSLVFCSFLRGFFRDFGFI